MSVAPVVMTSSIRMTGLPASCACAAGGTAKAPATLRSLWRRLSPALASRRAMSDQAVRGENAGPVTSAQVPCKLGSLIVAAPEIAVAVKRHRNDQRVVSGKRGEEPRHETGQEG